MSKQKKELVPELRFPEFTNSPSWESVYGNKAFEQISNKDHNSDLPILAITQEYGAIPRDMIDYTISVTEKSIQSYKVVDVGDFIISLRSFQGGIEFSDYKGLCSPAYVVLRNNKGIDKQFFKQYFKAQSFIRDLTKNLEGLRDGKMISYKQFSEVLLPKPSPDEQQKIANCLASIDELITAHSQKLDTLKTYKKGLMQQLFPAEGETVPKLRFTGFKGEQEWVKVSLGKLGELVSGLTYSPADVREEGLLVLRSSNVQHGRISLEDNVFVRPDVKGANYSEPDDILICVRNGSKALIGKNALIPKGLPKCTHGAFMTIFRSKRSKFIYQLLQTYAYDRQVAADLGATINSINGNQLKKYEFYIPKSEKKQETIANFLTSVDQMITSQTLRIDELKAHKKGLMQQLFPAMDKVIE